MPELQYVNDEQGVQRFETTDMSVVEYRAADGQKMRFEAFKKTTLLAKREIGVRITTDHSNFEYAAINSFYLLPTVEQTEVYAYRPDSDQDANDDSLEESEWAVTGELPTAVRSWCRAQWHGANFAHEVRTGPSNLFVPEGDPPFPPRGEFPSEWDSPGGWRVRPDSLVLTATFIEGKASGSVDIRNREGSPQAINVHDADNGHFKVTSGTRTVPAGGTTRVAVTYEDATRAGHVGTFEVDTPQGNFLVRLRGSARLGSGHR